MVAADPSSRPMASPTTSATAAVNRTATRIAGNRPSSVDASQSGSFGKVAAFTAAGRVRSEAA